MRVHSITVKQLQERLDLDRLLKFRLIVARFGEMDIAKWWNTDGQLGPLGTMTLRRGFPRTYHFAQARAVFAVAAKRCAEVFDPPGCVTLWRLSEDIEESFDARWEQWLDQAARWTPFFMGLERLEGTDLLATLRKLNAATDQDLAAFARLKRSSGDRAVQLPNIFTGSNDEIALLALGFARGEVGKLAVPYARRGDP